ncbi:hypothetical protein PY257_00930 [Ramlibacter sp. H39-3-26]|uniref:hypothetical protein n=1 Tax=Curvibacter soli TaxID=3031331 RepID=UPI0023DBFE80|nr:hypothetical protein [Ramlibacter sp. H39-3-26]MDF1483767.1 hypothetical protein [Ramlibacter sp. H39-3-26]
MNGRDLGQAGQRLALGGLNGLESAVVQYTIDEDKKRYLELLEDKLLLVTNTKATRRPRSRSWPKAAIATRGLVSGGQITTNPHGTRLGAGV